MQVDKDFGVMPTDQQVDETVSREGALQSESGRETKKHEYFTVGNASSVANPEDGLCLFAGEAPTRNPNGSTNFSLRAPAILISEIISDRQNIASVLAEVLNENAHRFFSSATDTQAGLKSVEDATRTAPGDGSQHDTKKLDEAKEIIRFYANPETYHALVFMGDSPCGAFADDFSDDHGDEVYDRKMPGARARSFLKENGE